MIIKGGSDEPSVAADPQILLQAMNTEAAAVPPCQHFKASREYASRFRGFHQLFSLPLEGRCIISLAPGRLSGFHSNHDDSNRMGNPDRRNVPRPSGCYQR
jgi:hypothetical protein